MYELGVFVFLLTTVMTKRALGAANIPHAEQNTASGGRCFFTLVSCLSCSLISILYSSFIVVGLNGATWVSGLASCLYHNIESPLLSVDGEACRSESGGVG